MTAPVLTISDRVAVLLRHKNETAQQLAEALGVHRATALRKLQKDGQWRPDELLLIANRYEVPVAWLMGEEQ